MFFLIIILQKKKHLLDLLQIYQFLPYQKKITTGFYTKENISVNKMSIFQIWVSAKILV